jgi:cation diffusion facilitator CzcD-associated flavoprotein CzcO
MAEFKVLIIGGGNCGLAIATGLKKVSVQHSQK